MKRLSVIFLGVLVLLSSIVFCACNDGWKNVKISCKDESISLVLDDEKLSRADIIFELSGTKDWDEVSVTTQPQGLVMVENIAFKDKKCGVQIRALQPSGDGATLIIKHLGADVSCSVPLKVGRKLVDLHSAGKGYVIQPQINQTEEEVLEYEIPTKSLVVGTPENYTNNIVWTFADGQDSTQIGLQSYDISGNKIGTAFNRTGDAGVDAQKINGESNAVRTVVTVPKNFSGAKEIKLNPVSVLDGKAVLHKNVTVSVYVLNLDTDKICVTSDTHKNKDGGIGDIVLVNNPSEMRGDELDSTYNYYSTAILKLQYDESVGTTPNLTAIPTDYQKLYTVQTSTNIQNLSVEQVGFDGIRLTALNSCAGTGSVKIKFVPKDMVGDISAFEIDLPVTCGERATGIFATRGPISDTQIISVTGSDGVFSSSTMLTDSNSSGEEFKFKILSENTLQGLKNYKITIDKKLLYISQGDIAAGTSAYVKDSEGQPYDLSEHIGYKYQICLMRGNRQMIFYDDGVSGNFVSEPLSGNNTLYIKYVATDNTDEASNFGITINNFYDNSYDLNDSGFDRTNITYNLTFTKQRTVTKIETSPISVSGSSGSYTSNPADGESANWEFYFTREMLADEDEAYGLQIDENVIGLNGSVLSSAEREEIELTISVSGGNGNLGWAKFNDTISSSNAFSTNGSFEFDITGEFKNLIVLGRTNDEELQFGEYKLTIKQGRTLLVEKIINIYKQMSGDDVKITIPTADYSGKMYLNKEDFGWNNTTDDEATALINGKLDSSYILSAGRQYDIGIEVEQHLVSNPSFTSSYTVVNGEGNEVDIGLANVKIENNTTFVTGTKGSYNRADGKKAFVKITYTFTTPEYSYYGRQLSGTESRVTKELYIYIYEPLARAYEFKDEQGNIKTNLIKYDYNQLTSTAFVDEWCYQTLVLSVNDQTEQDASIFDYITINWKPSGDGILDFEQSQRNKAKYKFGGISRATNGVIVATITQFGVSVPVYCSYTVNVPVLTDRVSIANSMGVFDSGTPYINLKVGTSLQIVANGSSNSEQPISLAGFSYAICSTTGYATSGVASVDASGKLTAKNAGRVKLVVVAKDRQIKSLLNVVNFFKTSQYVRETGITGNSKDEHPYVMIDVIVSDGTREHPYLISNGNDFEKIKDDFVSGEDGKYNDKYYAIVGDINLNGKNVTFDSVFKGGISSYNNARFSIYGVRITEQNASIFQKIECEKIDEEYLHANLENLNIYLSFNFTASEANKQYLLGFVGENAGYIKNCQFYLDGRVDGNTLGNKYIIGGIAGKNSGLIELTDTSLVGVQGSVAVLGTGSATVVLGGVAGESSGEIRGTLETNTSTGGGIEYEVYYGTQGAMANVELQVKNVDITRYDDSAIGGVVGANSGRIYGVYSLGKLLGLDDKNQLVVNNVGGIMGKNINTKSVYATLTQSAGSATTSVGTVTYADGVWQVENSYSTAQVYGRNNVGGVVGYDQNGEYKRVYYEIYDGVEVSIRGQLNVGGLVGYGSDTSMYYCYANSFAWDYTNTVTTYNIEASSCAGGLIGYGESSLNSYQTTTTDGLMVVSSAASLLINSQGVSGGIIGRSTSLVAIYTAYFYGVISGTEIVDVVKITGRNDEHIDNIPYNNVYVINVSKNLPSGSQYNTDTLENDDFTDLGNKFGRSEEYNNGKPYIRYNGGNLVSAVPTIIEINTSFEHYDDNTIDGYEKKFELYRENILGEYVREGDGYRQYDPSTDEGKTRYALMAELEDNIEDGNNSNYREKVFALYYYDFKLLDSDAAILDMQSLNSVNIRSLLLDGGIISKPNARRRFNVSSSNLAVVNPTSNGVLVVKGEGQATITITSMLNKNASASFVVIVRSKTLKFELYSSPNCLDDYELNGGTLNIVKNTSKLIYADYSTVVTKGVNRYEYAAPTQMEIHFTIEVDEATLPAGKTTAEALGGKQISDYIAIDATKSGDEYVVKYGAPITITVSEFFVSGRFKITAKAYIVLNYVSDLSNQTNTILIPLADYFTEGFYVATKKGISAINTDKTELDMMPADVVELKVKISTDIKVDSIDFDLQSDGDRFEFEIGGESVATSALLKVLYNGAAQTRTIDISGEDFDEEKQEIQFAITLKIDERGYYLTEEYKLDLQFNAGTSKEVVKISVKPQEISNIMVLNYRMGVQVDDLAGASLSNIIRPGSRNVLVIDIAPSIAVFDYLEIADLSENDKVLFMQQTLNEDGKLQAMPNMDKWLDNGIKLIKENSKTSKLYVYAMLPLLAEANLTHTLRVTAFDKDGKQLATSDVNLEAVLFPSVTLTYTYPNGAQAVADSRMAFNNDYTANAGLAVGVEAGIKVETSNIDEESLTYSVEIKKGSTTYNDYASFAYEQDGYVLRFNRNKTEAELRALVGGTISISFTASKQVNGVNETCKSTIEFAIRNYVIHSVSMSHTMLDGRIYGFYDAQFETEFYFGKTDVSYWTGSSYWNIQYRLDDMASASGVEAELKNILENLNNLGTSGVAVKFGNKAKFDMAENLSSSDYYLGVNGKDGIKIRNSNRKFQVVATSGSKINEMKIGVEFGLKFEDNNHILAGADKTDTIAAEYEFYVEKQHDPFEDYKTVSNQAEFEAMLEGNYYQLVNNISLENYYPISTNIAGFTGNGNTITIKSFNLDQLKQNYTSGELNIGLFGTIGEDVVIQNLVVNYENPQDTYTLVRINLSDYTVPEDGTLNNINVGGLAGTNKGVITNCLVKGNLDINAPQIPPTQIFIGGVTGLNGGTSSTKLATITKTTAEINLSGMAIIGGIAQYNNGKISTTVFKGTISSNKQSDYAASIYTSGFVVNNSAGASIALSAVLSSEDTITAQDMYTVGTLSGFVSTNAGSITDCYVTDVSMTAQGSIGGFAYQNSGTLIRCYANPNFEASRFYEGFVYDLTNYGIIDSCYVVTNDRKEINVAGLTKILKNDVADKSKYEGFLFTSSKYGVWTVKDARVVLTNAGYTQLEDYKSVLNIYDDVTFEGYLTRQLVESTIQNKMFNIVRDIDLSNLTDNPETYDKILSASIEGNGLTISGYNIYNSGNKNRIGLFGTIKQNNENTVFIRNLILKPASVKASKSEMVGALAGVIDGGYLYNIQIDASDVLILGRNAVGGLAGLIKGDFEIIGIKSNISVFSAFAYGVGNQYNLYLSKLGGGDTSTNNIDSVSYAGSVAGIVDGYRNGTPDMTNRTGSTHSVIDNVQIDGDIVLIAETVGGAFGLLGENSLASNIEYTLNPSSKYQSVYVAGGLVGENRGIIQDSRITNPIANECFTGFGRLVGGIVGLNIGGLVDNCSADIYISTNSDLATVGGIVGRNIEGTVNNCTVDGKLHAFFVGGIIGAEYSYSLINSTTSEYGSPTALSRRPLINIRNGVNYDQISGHYDGNKVGQTLIQNLLDIQASYYSYNPLYGGEGSGNLVVANSVFGLFVGITDRNMSVKTNDGSDAWSVKFADGYLMANLSASGDSAYEQYVISPQGVKEYVEPTDPEAAPTLGDDEVLLSALALLTGTGLNISNTGYPYTFLYIIASENATYEYWSPALGYCPEVVILSR